MDIHRPASGSAMSLSHSMPAGRASDGRSLLLLWSERESIETLPDTSVGWGHNQRHKANELPGSPMPVLLASPHGERKAFFLGG